MWKRFMASAALYLSVALAPSTQVSGGGGGGTLVHHYGCDGGRMKVPYREAGVQVVHRRQVQAGEAELGVQASLRQDDAAASTEIGCSTCDVTGDVRPGPRQRYGVWAGLRGRWATLSLGGVITDYLSVRRDEDGFMLLPRGALTLGPRQLYVDIRVLDTPPLPASSGGGYGIASAGLGSQIAPGHEITLALVAAPDNPMIGAHYAGQLPNGLLLGGGGYVSGNSAGAFLTIGAAIDHGSGGN